jgi:hypothetical protein
MMNSIFTSLQVFILQSFCKMSTQDFEVFPVDSVIRVNIQKHLEAKLSRSGNVSLDGG